MAIPGAAMILEQSTIDPRGDAYGWAARIPEQSGLVALFGALPWHIAALLEKCEDTARITALDPDGWRGYEHPQVSVVQELAKIPDYFDPVLARSKPSSALHIPSAKARHPELYKTWLSRTRKQFASVHSDVVTSLRFARDWNRNLILNMRSIHKSRPVRRLFGKWEKKPFVLVSAGPSLEDQLENVRNAKGKAFVCAVGSTVGRLEAEGIAPDAYIAFDGALDNYFAHFQGKQGGVPLIFDPICNHALVENWRGPLSVMSIWPVTRLLDDHVGQAVGHLQIGPSVANTAFQLALQMKADPIILVGQDLCFKDGRTHTRGLHQDHYANKAYDEAAPEFCWVPGVHTERVPSSRTFETFLNVFERITASCPARIVNTSGGARIPNTEDGPFPELGEDLTDELLALKADWLRPPNHNMGKLKDHIRTSIWTGERLKARLHQVDLKDELPKPDYSLYAFSFQMAWDMLHTERPIERVRQAVREALDYCLPMVRALSLGDSGGDV